MMVIPPKRVRNVESLSLGKGTIGDTYGNNGTTSLNLRVQRNF